MKKSIVISLLTITTLFCTALCSFASTGKVTTDNLKIRKEPSTDSEILEYLSKDDKIEILGGEENGWYKIKFEDKTGYVAAQYVSILTENNEINEDSNNQSGENEPSESQTPEPETNENGEVSVLAKDEKIYITPVINALVLDTLKEEKQIEVISEINGWSYIKMGTTNGWVRTQNIQRKEVKKETSGTQNNNTSSQQIGYINYNLVNFRKSPNTSADIITKLPLNVKVTIVNKGDTWSEVSYNGETGYVSNEYISETPVEQTSRGGISRTGNKEATQNKTNAKTTSKPITPEPTDAVVTGAISGADIIAYAKQYLGYKYTSGGATPARGFDCSGFTTYIFKHFGISLSRTSKGQGSNGIQVSQGELQVGDIICFSASRGSKSIGHVGIYVGGGKFIHSANSRQGVIISNVSGDGYYFVIARRVI